MYMCARGLGWDLDVPVTVSLLRLVVLGRVLGFCSRKDFCERSDSKKALFLSFPPSLRLPQPMLERKDIIDRLTRHGVGVCGVECSLMEVAKTQNEVGCGRR